MTDIYAVFNELSVSPTHREQTWTRYQANEWLERFSHLLYQAEQKNVVGLRTYAHPHEIELCEGYSLQDWFSDYQFNSDVRLRLQGIFTSLARFQSFPENQQGDPLVEYRHQGMVAYGLGAAHLLDSIAITLNTGNSLWQVTQLLLQIAEMEEESGELFERDDSVRHISEESHLESHTAWITDRLKTSVRNGKALLRKARELYPNLIFCKDAEAQLRQIPGGTPQFRRIVSRLFELEAYCQQWQNSGFEGNKLPNSSGESDSTMQQYGYLREFVCPDGQKRAFPYHLKGLPGNWRIHIWADEHRVFCEQIDEPRKILIGYVGKHLRTATG